MMDTPLRRPFAQLIPLVAVVWLALALASVLIFPRLLHPPLTEFQLQGLDREKRLQRQQEQRKLQDETRATLIQGLVGVLALVGASAGAYVAWRQLQENRRQQHRNEELIREGQVTERFTRAVEQLGHENQDVRLGGIYALERIASDSSRDRSAVEEILTAFVRGHAPWPPTRDDQPDAEADIWGDVERLRMRAPDVQAALTILTRRRPGNGPAQPLDLSSTDLRLADLNYARLQGAILSDARLLRAELFEAQLQEADFTDADLGYADLASAQLQRAYLNSADLYHASFQDASLEKADFRGALLDGATFNRAQLQQADLSGVSFGKVRFSGAQLQGANLRGARMKEADLADARLEGARCNAKTAWPEGFDWRAAGVEYEED